ncbi:hypothetical protein ATCC90586_011516 [Pythium insidiosum]|nr:hypothetical protein ATCC90586_011516 [Pythium insidiosum]
MEVPRLVHDELLHKLDDAQEEQLHHELDRLEHGARLADGTGADKTTESTPLLMAGKHRVVVDDAASLDLKALAMRLNDEERSAMLADAKADAMDIIRDETKHLLALAVPIIIVALLEVLPETLVSMMIGRSDEAHSTQILAAFSLCGLFQMLLSAALMNGLGSALDTLCSQAFGGKRLQELWLFMQAGFLMYLCCVPFVIVALLNGGAILRALGQDPEIAGIASKLLVMNVLALPFTILFSVLKSALQAQNIIKPFVMTSVISWVISLPLAYILGFWAKLGYMGIAFSIVVNGAVKALALIPVMLRNREFLDTWPGWQFRQALQLMPKISKLGVSSVLMLTFQMLGFSVISLLAGLLPNAAVMISANSIFASVLVLAFMPLLGISVAGAIRIGNALGAGQARRAALVSRIVMISSVSVATLGMFGVTLIATPFAHSFTTDTEAIKVAMQLLHSLLLIIPMLGFMFGIQSVFRACGKQLLCAKLNFVFLFVIGVPLGIVFALKLDAGILGLWYGNLVGTVGFMVAGGSWLYGLSWDTMAHEARLNTHLHVEESAAERPGSAA